jgi:hypothetical protein
VRGRIPPILTAATLAWVCQAAVASASDFCSAIATQPKAETVAQVSATVCGAPSQKVSAPEPPARERAVGGRCCAAGADGSSGCGSCGRDGGHPAAAVGGADSADPASAACCGTAAPVHSWCSSCDCPLCGNAPPNPVDAPRDGSGRVPGPARGLVPSGAVTAVVALVPRFEGRPTRSGRSDGSDANNLRQALLSVWRN